MSQKLVALCVLVIRLRPPDVAGGRERIFQRNGKRPLGRALPRSDGSEDPAWVDDVEPSSTLL